MNLWVTQVISETRSRTRERGRCCLGRIQRAVLASHLCASHLTLEMMRGTAARSGSCWAIHRCTNRLGEIAPAMLPKLSGRDSTCTDSRGLQANGASCSARLCCLAPWVCRHCRLIFSASSGCLGCADLISGAGCLGCAGLISGAGCFIGCALVESISGSCHDCTR